MFYIPKKRFLVKFLEILMMSVFTDNGFWLDCTMALLKEKKEVLNIFKKKVTVVL